MPARATDTANLPPTYIEISNLDIFRDEDIEYTRRLSVANVTTELYISAGSPHGWEDFVFKAEITAQSDDQGNEIHIDFI